MNNFVPNWDMEDDYRPFHDLLPPTNQIKSTRADQELIELVWQNGHVVMQNQSNRTRNGSSGVPNEFKQASKPEVPLKCGGNSGSANNFLQEEETAPWLQYPLGDPLDKDFCSDLFFGMPLMESIAADKLSRETLTGGRNVKFGIVEETEIFADPVPKQTSRIHIEENIMPPPKPQPISNTISPGTSATDGGGIVNFAHFSRPTKIDTAYMNRRSGDKIFENGNQRQVGESSSNGTKLSANCGSNQVQNQPDLIHTLSNSMSDAVAKEVEDVHKKFRERGQTETHDTATVTSSSAGSGSSVGRTCPNIINNQSHKRKGRDAEESDCHSEETEFQSDEAAKPTQRSASARRSRAAEVHNLSERRRRDRINEKMKALQELIPHCNKTDKASMLDEAIEYLKSLQLQVQMMWMGNGMAPMMFPSPQHYLSLMGRGMGHGSMPSLPSVVQMPRVPLVNQSMSPETGMNQVATTPPQTLNQIHPPNQMQNSAVPDAYTRYLGFHQMQQAPQVMSMFNPYGPQLTQANHAAVTAETNNLPSNGKSPTEIIQNGKIG